MSLLGRTGRVRSMTNNKVAQTTFGSNPDHKKANALSNDCSVFFTNTLLTFVVHDNNTLAIWVSPRESKETAENLVDWVCCNLPDAGYIVVGITLKSDGEEGTKALKGRVALKRKCETLIIQCPVRESTSNGAIGSHYQVVEWALSNFKVISRSD